MSIKKSQKGGKIIGSGAYGCVIKPALLCKPIVKKYHKNIVSKIIHINSFLSNDEKQEIKIEYLIGKYLHRFDKKGLYFLNPIQGCSFKLNTNFVKPSVRKDLKNCEIYGKKPELFNIVYPKGYDLFDLIRISNPYNFFEIITGHIAKSIQTCARKAKILLLDIKETNIIILQNNKNLLHPVLIDFSPEHVVYGKNIKSADNRYLYNFLDDYNSFEPLYPYWSPGIKTLLIKQKEIVKTTMKKSKYKEFLTPLKNKSFSKLVDMILNVEMMIEDEKENVKITEYELFNVYDYYYSSSIRGEQTNYLKYMIKMINPKYKKNSKNKSALHDKLKQISMEIHNDLVESGKVVAKMINSFNEETAEKIMIYQLGKTLYFLYEPYFLDFQTEINYIRNPEILNNKITYKKFKGIIQIHKLIFHMMHPNINKRPNAEEVMNIINILFSNPKTKNHYLIEPNNLIDKEKLKKFKEDTKKNITSLRIEKHYKNLASKNVKNKISSIKQIKEDKSKKSKKSKKSSSKVRRNTV